MVEIQKCIKCGELATRKDVKSQVHMREGYSVTTEDYYCKDHAPKTAVYIEGYGPKGSGNQPSLAAFMDVPLVKDLKGDIKPEKKKV